MRICFQLNLFKLCVFLVLLFFSVISLANEPVSISVDKKHAYSNSEISTRKKDYFISPTHTVEIDLSKIEFEELGEWKKSKPNYMQIIFDGDNMFSMEIDPHNKKYLLNVESLNVISGEFSGFKFGNRVILVISSLETNEKSGQHALTKHWMGAVTVLPNKIDISRSAHEVCYSYIYDYGASDEIENHHQYCEQAANSGDPNSITLLAETYYFGHGVDQNYKKAGQLFESAAKQGHVHAQLMMYFTYAVRLSDSSSDEQKEGAMRYLNKAASSGYQKAIEILEELSE